MNLILLSRTDFATPSRAVLRGRRFEHVMAVHRAAVGDSLRVGVLGGRMGSGTLVRLAATEIELEVCLDAEPPPKRPVTLLLALPRPKVLRRVLQTIAAMGVPRLVLVNAQRVEKSFWQSPGLAADAVHAELVLGLEQARDTVLPEVVFERLFKPLVEDRLPALAAGTTALVAHPPAAVECPRAVPGPVTLAIGPEGGFIPYEIDLLESRGFQAVTLGLRILRVEQAVPALLARLL